MRLMASLTRLGAAVSGRFGRGRYKPSIAFILMGLAGLLGVGQFFFTLWTADKTYLEVQTVRQAEETRRLAIIMAQGMSDRLRNVEHMTRRVVAAVPEYLTGTEISKKILDDALDDIGAYAQANEVGIGLFSQSGDGDYLLFDYRGSPDYRHLFSNETGSVVQLIATSERSNHTESTVAQTFIERPEREESGQSGKIKTLFALSATPLFRNFDAGVGRSGRPRNQVFFVSLSVLHPFNLGKGLPPECVFNNCEGHLKAETGARWAFISQAQKANGKKISASAPVWPLPFEVVITTYVSPLSTSIPGFRMGVIFSALVSGIAMILLLTAAIYFLVRRPLDQMRDGLVAIGDNKSARLPAIGLSEFSDVFHGFNLMAEKLEKVQGDLISTAARWRSLFEDNMSVMLMIDLRTNELAFANRAARKFYDIPDEEAGPILFNDLAADASSVIRDMAPAFERRVSHRTSMGVRTVDVTGGVAEIEGRATVLAIVTDATEVVALQHEANMAVRARFETLEAHLSSLNELVLRERSIRSTIAHELRNPLASISWAVENMEAQGNLPDGVGRRLGNIKRTLTRIEDLIAKGLSSKGDNISGLLGAASMEPQDIGVFVFKIARNWRDSDMRHRFHIQLEIVDMVANFDAFLMQSVVDNLVLNAIKYSSPGSNIFVLVDRKGDFVEFVVKDEGIGIPDSFLPVIGERLKRAPNALHLPGSGQGIYLCKSIVALHKGELLIESKENVGTKITVRIPVLPLKDGGSGEEQDKGEPDAA